MKAIPTIYKGITFKSTLEADVAFLLDGINCKWTYEPSNFLLDNGLHYQPGFWLPEQRLWIESHGYDSDKGEEQIKGFAKWVVDEVRIGPEMQKVDFETLEDDEDDESVDVFEDAAEFLVVREDASSEYYSYGIERKMFSIGLLPCCECKRWTFIGWGAGSQCRYCRKHNDSYNSPQLVLVEGRQGTLTVIDLLSSCGLREWVQTMEQRSKWLEGKKVIRCSNHYCKTSIIKDEDDLPFPWLHLTERFMEKYTWNHHFCSRECIVQFLLLTWEVKADNQYAKELVKAYQAIETHRKRVDKDRLEDSTIVGQPRPFSKT